MGAVLQQKEKNGHKPIGFFSKKFSSQEIRYTYDRELTAVFKAIKFFRYPIESKHFEIYTDHKPLIYAFQQKPEKVSPRQLRQLNLIRQFSTTIRFILGKDNEVADALSLLDVISLPAAISAEKT
ncbi:Retrovirus-related Pol polyprotein from transposon 412 [Anthophora retusa]